MISFIKTSVIAIRRRRRSNLIDRQNYFNDEIASSYSPQPSQTPRNDGVNMLSYHYVRPFFPGVGSTNDGVNILSYRHVRPILRGVLSRNDKKVIGFIFYSKNTFRIPPAN